MFLRPINEVTGAVEFRINREDALESAIPLSTMGVMSSRLWNLRAFIPLGSSATRWVYDLLALQHTSNLTGCEA